MNDHKENLPNVPAYISSLVFLCLSVCIYLYICNFPFLTLIIISVLLNRSCRKIYGMVMGGETNGRWNLIVGDNYLQSQTVKVVTILNYPLPVPNVSLPSVARDLPSIQNVKRRK